MRDYEGDKLVWVSAGSIQYDREDVELLLPYLYELRNGRYITRHRETGYIGGGRRNNTCPYEKAVLVAAEIDIRLAHTGQDRTFVELSFCLGWDDQRIASYFSLEEWYITRGRENAVSYISSGDCPRWLDCSKCGELDKCRRKRKGKKGVSYKDWCYRRNGRRVLRWKNQERY